MIINIDESRLTEIITKAAHFQDASQSRKGEEEGEDWEEREEGKEAAQE